MMCLTFWGEEYKRVELLDYSVRASMAYKSDMQSIQEYEDLVYGLALSKIENIELGYLTDNREGLWHYS